MKLKKLVATVAASAMLLTSLPVASFAAGGSDLDSQLKKVGVSYSPSWLYTDKRLNLDYNDYTSSPLYTLKGDWIMNPSAQDKEDGNFLFSDNMLTGKENGKWG
ncbi:hypothetical protein [Paenibacillus macquariensis]|uniref:Uncharacterized protein n=1 Tax=Paenibacillus macquariensis TaxID=948756 RepID=A0ABY1KEC8_9BACL|nr:hypothetical protein [Paenibacillus macquariensis]OAB33106.1 hypothetical protein PMSM_16280 [Paenibacillus macquariensis subsp. macquariensis]SIR70583.1 hypothetical protein SAMN05421578_1385 [Paenibacillus macquariensis]